MPNHEEDKEFHSFHVEGGAILFDHPKSEVQIAHERRQSEQHEFARDQVKTNKRLSWLTGCLVVASFFGTMIGIWQGVISQTAANAAREAADASKVASDAAQKTLLEAQKSNAAQKELADEARVESNKAADRSAKESTAALHVTVDNFHQDQRAWVGICDLGMSQFEVGKPIRARMKFCNTGKTPAQHVQEAMMWRLAPIRISGPSKEDFAELVYLPANSVPPQGSYELWVGSGGVGEAVGSRPLQIIGQKNLDAAYQSIFDGTTILYYFGMIRYKDVFGVIRHTKFCVLLSNAKSREMTYCDEYNELD